MKELGRLNIEECYDVYHLQNYDDVEHITETFGSTESR